MQQTTSAMASAIVYAAAVGTRLCQFLSQSDGQNQNAILFG